MGGGGKTGAILRLTAELRAQGRSVLVSTTTKVGESIASVMPSFRLPASDPVERVGTELARHGAIFVAAGRGPDGKLVGPEPSLLSLLAECRVADIVLVEADGSRQRPLKIPNDHEPVIPDTADLVCPMVGIDALGQPVSGLSVHRHELIGRVQAADVVTESLIAAVVTSERGGLKGVPPQAAVRPIINKVAGDTRRAALAAARAILKLGPRRLDRVVVADIREAAFTTAFRPPG